MWELQTCGMHGFTSRIQQKTQWIFEGTAVKRVPSIYPSKSFWGLAFATAPLSPLREHLVFSLFYHFFTYIFFLSLFPLIFLSYHCSTNISFLSLFHLYFSYHYPSWVDFFFTFQHSLGCFWLVSVVHSTSLVAFSFSYYFRVLRTGILQGLLTCWYLEHLTSEIMREALFENTCPAVYTDKTYIYIQRLHSVPLSVPTDFFFFFLRDFIFKKTLFEKLQYLKQEDYLQTSLVTLLQQKKTFRPFFLFNNL